MKLDIFAIWSGFNSDVTYIESLLKGSFSSKESANIKGSSNQQDSAAQRQEWQRAAMALGKLG